MGNTQGFPNPPENFQRTDGVPGLDELGGYYRPAISRKNELNVKSAWLGNAVLVQANVMEDALDLNNTTSKEMAMAITGAPKDKRNRTSQVQKFGFGSTYANGHRPSTSRTATRSSMPEVPRQRPATATGATGVRQSIDSALKPTAPARSANPLTKSLDASHMSYAAASAIARPHTAQAGVARVQPDLPSIGGPGAAGQKMRRPPVQSARKSTKQAALEAKKQAEAEAQMRAGHWRTRVWQAKRRLYLYLKGYMAWMSVLKKMRKGYAEPLPVEVLPVFVTNALGDFAMQFGEHLKNCGGLIEQGPEAKAKLQALGTGRLWLSRLRVKHLEAAAPSAMASSEAAAGSSARSSEATGASESQPPAVQAGAAKPARARGGARGAPVGSGANAVRSGAMLAGGGIGSALMVKQAIMEDSKQVMRKSKFLDPRARHQKEVEVVRRITERYLARPVSGAVWTHRERGDVDNMMKAEAVNLQMLANKANARWVEALNGRLSPATVLESKILSAGGVDVGMYQKSVGDLLGLGKIAVQVLYLGEEQVVGSDARGQEAREPAIQTDMWAAIAKMFPHKVPSGQRVTGLTLLDRRVLQMLVDVEKSGGKAAVGELKILLCVDSLHVGWVAEQIAARHHWMLQPHQIVVVSIARFPGIMWEDVTKTFMINYSHEFPYASAGTGYAMLALAWPSHAFTVTTAGGREYIAGSTLNWLHRQGVEYIHTSLLIDMDHLAPGTTPAVDPAFCGPALYAIDMKDAGMAMQVVTSTSDMQARQQNSLVLCPMDGNPLFSISIPFNDIQTSATRVLLMNAQRRGCVVSCTNRYFASLPHLSSLLQGPNSFHMDVEVRTPCAHVQLDMADLTSHPQAKCVSVMGKAAGPDPRCALMSKEWLRDFGAALMQQDAQPAFRARVGAMMQAQAQTGNTAAPVASVQEGSSSNTQGSHIMLLVANNNASRYAFRLARALLRVAGDTLTLVHVLTGFNASADDGNALLSSFSDVMVEHQIRRKLLRQGDKLADTLVQEVESSHPDLVVIGSEALSAQQQSRVNSAHVALGSGALTSVAIALAKSLTSLPLLIVKTNCVGEFFQTPDVPGVSSTPIKVALEVQAAALPVLQWLGPRVCGDKERPLVLTRPYGVDKATYKETPQTQRVMAAFSSAAGNYRLTPRKLPLADGPSEGYPPMVAAEKVDMLAMLAPSAKVTPPHLLDLMRTARTNLLIWRLKSSLLDS